MIDIEYKNFEFLYMMYLAGCGAQGKTPDAPLQNIDWKEVLRYAQEQSVNEIVSYSIILAEFKVPIEVLIDSKSKLRNNAVAITMRRIKMQPILNECDACGVHVAVIKGYAIADDYALPETRMSADIDLLVDIKDENRVIEILSNYGFSYRRRSNQAKDTHLYHPLIGVVELHIKLYENFIYKLWYKDVDVEPECEFVKRETCDGTYYTLNATEHLLFIILHMMKHFIVDGCSLKMLIDIGIIMNKRYAEIDFVYIESILQQLRYDRAFVAYTVILKTICSFNFSGNMIDDIDMADYSLAICEILQDMEYGGTRGIKTENDVRKSGLLVYNAEMYKKGKTYMNYKIFICAKKGADILNSLFPSVSAMRLKYGFLEKYPILYPVAWARWIIKDIDIYLIKREKKLPGLISAIGAEKMTSDVGKRKAQMFRDMGMI